MVGVVLKNKKDRNRGHHQHSLSRIKPVTHQIVDQMNPKVEFKLVPVSVGLTSSVFETRYEVRYM